jgi:hypothetical protein
LCCSAPACSLSLASVLCSYVLSVLLLYSLFCQPVAGWGPHLYFVSSPFLMNASAPAFVSKKFISLLFSFFPSVNSLGESSSVCSVQYKRKRQIYSHCCTVFSTINLLIETQRVCVGMTTEGGKHWSLRASATAPSHSSTTPGQRPRPHTGIVSVSKH